MSDIIQIHEENEAFQHFLTGKLRAYNDLHSFHHRQIRNANVPVIQLKVEERGEVIGGLFGSVYWGWFDLDRLWVDADHAKTGIGTRLLQEGERQAIQLGAKYVKLTTFSFQAKTFYEKFGYEVAGVLHDFPPGSDYYMMTKSL